MAKKAKKAPKRKMKKPAKAKKRAPARKRVKKVTIADLSAASEFKGRHKLRVARRPLMRDIRTDQKRVTRSMKGIRNF